tara:strand:- start:43 stop:306 length:264 start_codon:yes stop_codon:yes gene_type:complete
MKELNNIPDEKEIFRQMKKQFSCNLVYLMMRDSISSNSICNQFRISPQTLSAWRRGKGLPTIARLSVISNHFGVSIENLLGPMEIKP